MILINLIHVKQAVNLQAELAYIQARISTMQRFPFPQQAAESLCEAPIASYNSNSSNIQSDDQLRQQFLSSSELAYNANNNNVQ